MYLVAFKARHGYYMESFRLFESLSDAYDYSVDPRPLANRYWSSYTCGTIWEVDMIASGCKSSKPLRVILKKDLEAAGIKP